MSEGMRVLYNNTVSYSLTIIVLHKYTHVKPAALPYLRVTAAAVLNKSVELDWN